MPSKNPAQRLADIIDNVDAIQGFTADLDFLPFGLTEIWHTARHGLGGPPQSGRG